MLERIKSFFSKKTVPDPRDAEIQAFQTYVQELESAKSVLELALAEKTAQLQMAQAGLSKVLAVVDGKVQTIEADLRDKASRCDSQAYRVKLNFGADTLRDLRLRIASLKDSSP